MSLVIGTHTHTHTHTHMQHNLSLGGAHVQRTRLTIVILCLCQYIDLLLCNYTVSHNYFDPIDFHLKPQYIYIPLTVSLVPSLLTRRAPLSIAAAQKNFAHARAKCTRLSILSGCDRKRRTPRKETGYEATLTVYFLDSCMRSNESE